MGGRPLAGFQQVGIDVRFKEGAGTVQEAELTARRQSRKSAAACSRRGVVGRSYP